MTRITLINWAKHHTRSVNPLSKPSEPRTVPIASVCVQPGSKRFATAGQDGDIKIWSLQTLLKATPSNDTDSKDDEILSKSQMLATLTDHANTVNCIRFSDDGYFLVSGGDDGNVNVYAMNFTADRNGSLGNGNSLFQNRASKEPNIEDWALFLTFKGHTMDVQHVNFSRHARFISSCSVDNTVRVWNFSGHKQSYLKDHYHPKQRFFRSIAHFETGTNFLLKEHSSWAKCAVFDPMGVFLASYGDDKAVVIYDIKQGFKMEAVVKQPFKRGGETTYKRTLSWSPDGKFLVVSHCFDHPRNVAYLIQRNDWFCYTKSVKFVGHTKPVSHVAFSPCLYGAGTDVSQFSSLCAVACEGRTLTLWNPRHGKPIQIVRDLFTAAVFDISWSSCGSYLFCCSLDGNVVVIDFSSLMKEAGIGRSISYQHERQLFLEYLKVVYGQPFSQFDLDATGTSVLTGKNRSGGKVEIAPDLIQSPEHKQILKRLEQKTLEKEALPDLPIEELQAESPMESVEHQRSVPEIAVSAPIAVIPREGSSERPSSGQKETLKNGKRRIQPVLLSGPSLQPSSTSSKRLSNAAAGPSNEITIGGKGAEPSAKKRKVVQCARCNKCQKMLKRVAKKASALQKLKRELRTAPSIFEAIDILKPRQRKPFFFVEVLSEERNIYFDVRVIENPVFCKKAATLKAFKKETAGPDAVSSLINPKDAENLAKLQSEARNVVNLNLPELTNVTPATMQTLARYDHFNRIKLLREGKSMYSISLFGRITAIAANSCYLAVAMKHGDLYILEAKTGMLLSPPLSFDYDIVDLFVRRSSTFEHETTEGNALLHHLLVLSSTGCIYVYNLCTLSCVVNRVSVSPLRKHVNRLVKDYASSQGNLAAKIRLRRLEASDCSSDLTFLFKLRKLQSVSVPQKASLRPGGVNESKRQVEGEEEDSDDTDVGTTRKPCGATDLVVDLKQHLALGFSLSPDGVPLVQLVAAYPIHQEQSTQNEPFFNESAVYAYNKDLQAWQRLVDPTTYLFSNTHQLLPALMTAKRRGLSSEFVLQQLQREALSAAEQSQLLRSGDLGKIIFFRKHLLGSAQLMNAINKESGDAPLIGRLDELGAKHTSEVAQEVTLMHLEHLLQASELLCSQEEYKLYLELYTNKLIQANDELRLKHLCKMMLASRQVAVEESGGDELDGEDEQYLQTLFSGNVPKMKESGMAKPLQGQISTSAIANRDQGSSSVLGLDKLKLLRGLVLPQLIECQKFPQLLKWLDSSLPVK